MQFTASSGHFAPFRPQYCPKHPVYKLHKSELFIQSEEPGVPSLKASGRITSILFWGITSFIVIYFLCAYMKLALLAVDMHSGKLTELSFYVFAEISALVPTSQCYAHSKVTG
jgi:hypothetical protein